MGAKNRINEAVKESMELNKEAFEKFLAALPETMEEVTTMKTMKGSDIIAECLAQGDTAGAAQHDSTKTYDRYYTTLRLMDHRANAMSAFRRKGIAGLKSYSKKVMRQAFYIKGKYPQYFSEDQGAPIHTHTLWQRMKHWVGLSIVLLAVSCAPDRREATPDAIYAEYLEGFRMGRIWVNRKTSINNMKEIISKDSLRIYQYYK